MPSRKTPSRHRAPRNRARQSAARELAAREGLTYQQALRRLATTELPWWSTPIRLQFKHRTVFDELRARVPVAQFLSEQLDVEWSDDGPGRLAGHCPFHEDSTPSLKVSDGDWRCFGCGRSGGLLDAALASGRFGDSHAEAAAALAAIYAPDLRVDHQPVTHAGALDALVCGVNATLGLLPGGPTLRAVDAHPDPWEAGCAVGEALLSFQAADPAQAAETSAAVAEALLAAVGDIARVAGALRPPLAGRELNTRLTYTYADADNYKATETVVLAGEPALGDLDVIRDAMQEGFIPSQVGLEDLQARLQAFDSAERAAEIEADPSLDPDHPWHWIEAFIGDGVDLTDEPASQYAPTLRELVIAFRDVEWNDVIAVR